MIESIYPKLPISLQNVACTLYGYREKRTRFNRDFLRYCDEYQKSQFAGRDEIIVYQEKTLRELLRYCQQNVPYYRDLLSQYAIETEAKDVFAELARLPVMRKEELRAHGERLLAGQVPKEDVVEVHTSGTTGKALTLFKDKQAFAKQWAIWFRHRQRFGCKFGDLHVNFTGKLVVPAAQKSPPYWRFNRAFHQYLLNMQHVKAKNIRDIVNFLNSISPKFYSGYPSIIAEAARLALEHDLPLMSSARPQFVFAGAENTLDYQKSAIEEWTGAVVTDQYGLTEGNCNLSRCEHGNYHEDHEFCYAECVDAEQLEDGRRRGRLVGTSFANMAMPLLRYDTGDIATWKPADFKCPCGRESAVVESIEGRIDDFVELNDGRRIMRFDYLFKSTDRVKEAQVCQYKLGEVVIKLVSRGEPDAQTEDHLRSEFAKWICPEMVVNFEYVDHIPRSKTGKFKAVQSYL